MPSEGILAMLVLAAMAEALRARRSPQPGRLGSETLRLSSFNTTMIGDKTMIRILTFVLLSISMAPLQAVGTGSGSASLREKRADLVAKLRTDLAKAATEANLDEKQKNKLEKAQEKLAEAEAALRKGGMLSPFKMLKMKGALEDIEEIARSNAFRPEDRQLIQEDIKQIKETRKSQGGD